MEDQIQLLYDNLNGKEGINLGSLDEFNTFMADSSNRAIFFDSINSPEINLGESSADFESWLNPSNPLIDAARTTGKITVDDNSKIDIAPDSFQGAPYYKVKTPNEEFTFFNQEEASLFDKAFFGLTKGASTFVTETAAAVASLPEMVHNLGTQIGEGIFNTGDAEFNYRDVFDSKIGTAIRDLPEDLESSQTKEVQEARQRLSAKAPNWEEVMAGQDPGARGNLLADPEARRDMARVFFSGETLANLGDVLGIAGSFFVPGAIAGRAKVGSSVVNAINNTSGVQKLTNASKIAKKVSEKAGDVADFALGVELMSGLEADMEARDVEETVTAAAYNNFAETDLSPEEFLIAEERGELDPDILNSAKSRGRDAGVETFNYNQQLLRVTNIIPAASVLGKFGKTINKVGQTFPKVKAISAITGSSISEGLQEGVQTAIAKYEEAKYATDLYYDIGNKKESLWAGPGQILKEGMFADYDLLEAGVLGAITAGIISGPGEIAQAHDQIKTNRFKKTTPAKDFVGFKNAVQDGNINVDEFNSRLKDYGDSILDLALITEGQTQGNPDIIDYGFQKAISRGVYHGLSIDQTPGTIRQAYSQMLDDNYQGTDELFVDVDGSNITYGEFKQKKLDYVDNSIKAYDHVRKLSNELDLNSVDRKDYYNNYLGFTHFSQKQSATENEIEVTEDENLKQALGKKVTEYEAIKDKYKQSLDAIVANKGKSDKEIEKEAQKRAVREDPNADVSDTVRKEVQQEQDEQAERERAVREEQLQKEAQEAKTTEELSDLGEEAEPFIRDKVNELREAHAGESLEKRYEDEVLRDVEFSELSRKLQEEYTIPEDEELPQDALPEIDGQPLNDYLTIDSVEKIRSLEEDPIAKPIIDAYYSNLSVPTKENPLDTNNQTEPLEVLELEPLPTQETSEEIPVEDRVELPVVEDPLPPVLPDAPTQRLIGVTHDRIPVGESYNPKIDYTQRAQVAIDYAANPNEGIEGRNFINQGKVKKGDVVFLEREDTGFGDDTSFTVAIVGYEKNGKLATKGNRLVLGQLLGIEGVPARVREMILESGPVKTTVADTFARVLYDSEQRNVNTITDDPIIAISVGKANPVLKTNGATEEFKEPTIVNAGGAFVLVPWINGEKFPVRLFTKFINQLPEVQERIRTLLNNIVANPTESKEEIRELQSLVRWTPEHDNATSEPHFTERNGFLEWNGKTYTNPEVLYDALEIDKRRLHIDAEYINDVVDIDGKFQDYNAYILDNEYVTTDAHPDLWHSPGIEVNVPTVKPKVNLFTPNTNFKTSGDIAVPESDAEAKEWFKKRFEEINWVVDDAHIDKMTSIYLKGGERAWGMFQNASVILASARPKGTTKHEAFHVAFNLFLTDKQREQILSEGLTEEELANQFEDYRNSLFSDPKFPKAAKFIESLYNFIYQYIDILRQYITDKITVNDLFRRIENNSLGRDLWGNRKELFTKNVDSFADHRFKIQNSEGKVWTGDVLRRRIDLVNKAIIPQLLGDQTLREYLRPETTQSTTQLTELFNTVADVLVDRLPMFDQLPDQKADMNLLIEGLRDETSEIFAWIVRDLKPTYNIDFDFNEETTFLESWQQNYTSINPKDRMSARLRRELSVVPVTKDGELVPDDLGSPIYRRPTELYNILIRTVSNSTSLEDAKSKIDKAMDSNPWMEQVRDMDRDIFQLSQYSHVSRIGVSAKNKDGGYVFKVFDANRRSIARILFQNFRSTHSDLTITDFKKTLNSKPNKTTSDLKELMDGLGFVRPLAEIESVAGKKKLASNLALLYSELEKGNDIFSTGNAQTRAAIDSITKEITKSNTELFQSTINNVKGKKEYMHIQSGYIWKVQNEIKNGTFDFNERKTAAFHKHAPIYDLLRNRAARDSFRFVLVDGISGGQQYSDFQTKDIDTFNFAAFIEGQDLVKKGTAKRGTSYFSVPPMADAPSSYSARVPFFDINSEAFKNLLYSVHLQEVSRQNVDSNIENFSENKNKLHFFPVTSTSPEKAKDQIINHIEQEFQDYKERVEFLGQEEDVLREYFYNQYFWNTQFITLLSGDPAFYKGSGDFQKRFKQVHAPGEYGLFDKLQYSVAYIEDIELESTMDLEDFKDLQELYGENSLTDAQGYHTLDRRKEIEEAYGWWTKEKEQELDNLKAGRPTKGLFLEPLKPHLYYQKREGELMVPVQHKYSSVTLLPVLTKTSPKLNELRKSMERGGVDEVIFNSAVKVGERDAVTEDQALNGGLVKQYFDNKYFKIQQEIPSHFFDTTQSLGTQIRKLIESNLQGSYNIDGQKMTANEVRNSWRDLLVEDLNANIKAIDEKVGTTVKLSDYLADEVLRRDESLDLLESIKIVGDEFNVPLWHPFHAARVEALINSVFKKAVQFNVKGGSFVNMSGFGYEDLKVNIENGAVKSVDVAITAYDPEILALFKDTGSISIDQVPDKLKKRLKGVLYRIPTEHKYSMFPFEVKRILHPNNGGVVVLPREATTIAGLDFDIDKVMAAFYADPLSKEEWATKISGGTLQTSALGNAADILGGTMSADFLFSGPSYKDYTSQIERDNKKLDIMRGILTAPQNAREFLEPGGFSTLERLAEELGDTDNLPIASPNTSTTFAIRNLVGLRLIGIFANANAHHAQIQDSDLSTVQEWEFNGERVSSLTPKKDVVKVLAELLAASVDNAKNPVLGTLNINTITAPTVTLMARLGIDLETIVHFMNQSSIRNAVALVSDTVDLKQAVENILSASEESISAIDVKLSDLQRQDPLESYQRSILKTFSGLVNASNELNKIVQASRLDAGTGPRISNVERSIRLIDRLHNNPASRIKNIKQVLPVIDPLNFKILEPSNSVIDKFIEVTLKEAEYFSQYFPYFDGLFMEVKTNLESIRGDNLSPSAINYINNEIVNYLSTPFFPVPDKKKFIESFPEKLNKFKLANPSLRWSNLMGLLTVEDGFVIAKTVGGISPEDMTVLRGEFEAVMTEHPELELEKYAFHTRGFNFGPKSLFQLMPVSFFTGPYKEFIKNELEVPPNASAIQSDILLNHFDNPAIVRRYEGEVESQGGIPGNILINDPSFQVNNLYIPYVSMKIENKFYLFEHLGSGQYIRIATKGIPGQVTEYMTNTYSSLPSATPRDIAIREELLDNPCDPI